MIDFFLSNHTDHCLVFNSHRSDVFRELKQRIELLKGCLKQAKTKEKKRATKKRRTQIGRELSRKQSFSLRDRSATKLIGNLD